MIGIRRLELTDIQPQPSANNDLTSVISFKAGDQGARILDVELILTPGAGVLPAEAFGDIRTTFRDKTRRTSTLRQLDDLLAFRQPKLGVTNLGVKGGIVRAHYPFAEWDRKQVIASERTALDMNNGEVLRIEVDVRAKANPAAIAARITYRDLAQYVSKDNPMRGGVMGWTRNPININAQVMTLPDFTRNGRLYQIGLYDPAGTTIRRVIIENDEGTMFKRTKEENDIELLRHDLNPVPGRFDLVFDLTDDQNDAPDWRRWTKFDVTVELAAAPAAGASILSMVQEYVPLT